MSSKKVKEINDLSEDIKDMSINGETPKSSRLNGIDSEETPKSRSKNRKKKSQTTKDKPIMLSDIGGYNKQINQLKDLIELPLEMSSQLRQMSQIGIPRTVLLFGPTGTGKTLTIGAFFNELNQKMFCLQINCATILGKTFSVSEDNIKTIFTNAIEMSPSLVFLDNFEMICSKKKSNIDQESRLICVLATILNKLPNDKHIVVVMATNSPDSIDLNFRERIDTEIEFSVPLPTERLIILKKLLNNNNCEVTDEELKELSINAHSYTGFDLNLVCRKSVINAMKEKRRLINKTDLINALKSVRPTAMREITLEVPNVFWSDIGGMHSVRSKLTQCVVWPLTNPEAFERIGIEPPKGVLMYGPPGCCKTMIGKALATESGLNFLSIKGPELFDKWVGESERAVREVFRKARAASPSILFFDEIDALAAERDSGHNTVGNRVLAQMLTEIDGIEKLNEVIIVAATNRPDMIDKALLRPGRLDSILYVPLPDFETRFEILRIKTAKMSVNFEQSMDETLKSLAEATDGYTGAEVTAVCQEAGLIALESDINISGVDIKHFLLALETVRPQISSQDIEFYEKYRNDFNKNHRK